MADYKESDVSGKQWTRCKSVLIDNSYGKAPMVHLGEETAVTAGAEVMTREQDGISFPFDPALVINLRNPETGELIPGASMTGLELYVALYSLYIQKAVERDLA